MAINQTKFYYNFHYPMQVVPLLLDWVSNNPDQSDPAEREWFSQPRTFDAGGTEVISTIFKLPLSVSEISLEILRVPCSVEIWYQDRSNNWRPVLDNIRLPIRVTVNRSDTKSFYKHSVNIYPIVAKQLQIRITRMNDSALSGVPYPVGLRNVLIRRNVYNRSQGQQYFEDEEDVFGNIVAKYIKDWDATKAIDDDPYTFWRSGPMPDPAAVANLYLDLRTPGGSPSTVDKLWIDPIYQDQHLNLYYSNDDTIGTRKLSPITLGPDEDDNTDWRLARGRWDTSSGLAESVYRWSMSVGPQIKKNAWIGVEWTPDFDADDGPPQNPVLYSCIDPDTPGVFKPKVEYDVGAGAISLTLDDSDDPRDYNVVLDEPVIAHEPLRIVVGWSYTPDMIYISVTNRSGVEIARAHEEVVTLPDRISFDGQSEIANFKGTMTALIVKLENYAYSSAAFQNSPTYYTDPDPVIPDPQTGVIPATTLDNAIYAVSWTAQEHGSGGNHETAYEDKTWTPIWRDYICERGMLFLPKATPMKYLKMEFTNLTPAPYPIYESGVEVRYKVFPISVSQQLTQGIRAYSGYGQYVGGTLLSYNGVKAVNWMDWNNVAEALNQIFGPNYSPVVISQGSGYVSDTLPNQNGVVTDVSSDYRFEWASSYIYRRDVLQPYIVAENEYVTTIKAEGLQKLNEMTTIPWEDIEASNPGAITHVKSVGALPVRGTDWWIYPGQLLKIPANVMVKLTDTNVVNEGRLTQEWRTRFNTTSVHKYEYKTLKRDATLAYFAGLREVIPFVSSYIAGEDKPFFDFPAYDPDQFALTNTRAMESGPITTERKLYNIPNRLFEKGLGGLKNWQIDDDDVWVWDGTTGRWNRGTAKLTADNLNHEIVSSSIQVGEGEEIDFSVLTKWDDLVITADDDDAIRLVVRYYLNDVQIDEDILEEVSFADWAASATSSEMVEYEDEDGWVTLSGTSTVVEGANKFRIVMQVTNKVESGTVWFENPKAEAADDLDAEATKAFQTASSFVKVAVDFKDSGLRRGDSMWADINPDSESISDTALAYYTKIIPEEIAGGSWGDTIKTWGGDDIEWGSAFGLINVTIDPNRRYQGKRVLRFRRAGGSVGEAGVKVKQWTHYVAEGLFRIGAVYYKPFATDNEIIVRLRRLSDGVFIYEETLPAVSGRWHEFTTKLIEIPDSTDQEYEVILTIDGDDEDEMYLSDLYTEIAHIRYYIRLGTGGEAITHEVTDLRYADGRAVVTCTTPVRDVSVRTSIKSPEAWAYGLRLTPYYLK